MAPVTVYTDSPIAAKPSGVTPKTLDPAGPETRGRAAPPATSTTSTTTTSSYPSAQPGAAPSLPTPTAAAPTYAPAQPTPTQPLSSDDPPPPQPSAVPSIPPPPKVGERYEPPQVTPAPQATPAQYPQQMSVPAPTPSFISQQRGTSTTASSATQPPPLSLAGIGTQSVQHPPGYRQNTNASGLDNYQRSAALSPGEAESQDKTSETAWGAAKKWAQQTGEKLAAAESEVWKKINKE
ncbi:hypothetical protein F4778DRAFT_724848 [Xylariomycetidae sp. FL2044]|nr:hypothetical protein F4778DRAFT_724848 [Xylariomycetidae sp. FL2044]